MSYSGQCYLSAALSGRSANRGECAQYCRLPYSMVDANGTETGIWVDASTQTKGIGSAVAEDDFLKQFDGLDCTQNVVMGENGVDGKTGATFSSKALFAAINDCVNCYNELA